MAAGTPVSTHLQLARVDELLAQCPAGLAWLTDSERRRVEQLAAPRRRAQFLAGHWLLRRIAAEAFDDLAADWQVEHASGQAPRMHSVRDTARGRVFASLSHSGDWVAAAIGRHPLGVDVECPRKARDWQALAKMAFSPAEQHELAQREGLQARDYFILRWTLKEAEGKRGGHGLQLARARGWQPVPCDAAEAEFHSWELADGAVSLATEAGGELHLAGFPATAPALHWCALPIG